MNETGIIIRAGNVTIVGIRIETTAAAALETDNTDTSSSSSSSVNVTAADAALKMRAAAFNGSLGFYTLGVEVQVLGKFALQRAMDWQYNSTVKAWATQVAIAGKFHLTRDDTVQGQTSLDSRVKGSLTLYSSLYPGPGFNGVYDWAGQLGLNPDPFTVWSDASALLANSSSSSSKRRRFLLQAGGSDSTGTGNVPVQGRVAVRETGSAGSSSSSSSSATVGASTPVALDDSGDIMVLGPPPADVCEANPAICPATSSMATQAAGKILQTGAPAAAADSSSTAGLQPSTSLPKLQVPRLAVSPKVLIVIAALAGPTALAPCAMGIVAGVLHRKRRRQREEQQETKRQHGTDHHQHARAAAVASANAEAEPGPGASSREGSFKGVAGSSGTGPARASAIRRRISSTAGYASHDGTTNSSSGGNGTAGAVDGQSGYSKGRNGGGRGANARFKKRAPGASSGAALERSANGSQSSSPGGSFGELEGPNLPVQQIGSTTATEVQFLEVGETGIGSVCGGLSVQGRSVRDRSNRDSIDLQSNFEPAAGPRPGRLQRQQQQQHYNSLRSSLSGMANGIKSAVNGLLRSSQAGAAYKVPKSGEAALQSSLDYPIHGMGERGPTLPGARRGSVDVPAAAAADYAANLLLKATGIAAQVAGSAGGSEMPAMQQQQLAAAATSAQLQRSVPAKWVLPTAGVPSPAAAAAATGAAFGSAASAATVNSFFAVTGGIGPNGMSATSSAAKGHARGSLEQMQQIATADAAAEAAAGGAFMTSSRWRQQQQQPGAGGSPRPPPGENITVWDSPLFK